MLDKLVHAARFSLNPTFSLFHVSSSGHWGLILSGDAEDIVGRFKEEAVKPTTAGLEVRCDGVKVEL